MTTAVIFVPTDHIEWYASQCYAYCLTMGYEVAGIVRGNWGAAVAMLVKQTANVLVVARPEHLDDIAAVADEPRIEFAVPPDAPHARPGERRIHVIPPGAAA